MMRIRFRTFAACALPLVLSIAQAQMPPATRPDPADPDVAVPPATYRSALARYRAHAEAAVGSWKEANDNVARIGGWRVYAREASQPDPPAAKPAASAPHAGHGTR